MDGGNNSALWIRDKEIFTSKSCSLIKHISFFNFYFSGKVMQDLCEVHPVKSRFTHEEPEAQTVGQTSQTILCPMIGLGLI